MMCYRKDSEKGGHGVLRMGLVGVGGEREDAGAPVGKSLARQISSPKLRGGVPATDMKRKGHPLVSQNALDLTLETPCPITPSTLGNWYGCIQNRKDCRQDKSRSMEP